MNELTVEIAEETIQLEWSRERNELFDLVFSVLQGGLFFLGLNFFSTWKNKYLHFKVTQNRRSLSPVIEDAVLRGGYKLRLPSNKELFIVVNATQRVEVWYHDRECISNAQSGELGYINYFEKAGNWLVGVGLFWVIQVAFVDITVRQVGTFGGGTDINIGALINSVIFGLLFIGVGIWGMRSYNPIVYWIGVGLCLLRFFTAWYLNEVYTNGLIGLFTSAAIMLLIYYCYQAATSVPPKYRIRKKRTLESGSLDAGI
jgi:hypothetical protein